MFVNYLSDLGVHLNSDHVRPTHLNSENPSSSFDPFNERGEPLLDEPIEDQELQENYQSFLNRLLINETS